ncbi:MAG: hypothetical protein WC052_05675 [Patescibacteria group bacterium]
MATRIETVERDLFREPLWFSRPNIRFAFNAKAYQNGTFGTRVGPTDSLLEAGLHELAHCIDFELTGKPARLQYEALEFKRPYANALFAFGKWHDDFPLTTRGSWSEIRTNAIQALLMMKAFGTCYRYSYDAMLDDIVECSVEEMLSKSAKSLWVLDDAINFKSEMLGCNPIGVPVEELYFNAMMKYYNQIDTPFGTQRIVQALNCVNKRLGQLHAKHESHDAAKG